MCSFWQETISRYGRHLLFVDSGAILGSLERDSTKFESFFNNEAVGWRLITSHFVVTETVRRLGKAKQPNKFSGPNGEKAWALCRYVLHTWLDSKDVLVLSVPEEVFDLAKRNYCERTSIECDLTDMISATIVRGLEQQQIVADDSHFGELGLSCLPG